ncbi:MAG: hypothetical protein JXB88_16680 [Spirochaetales bacterium]|nr:hypothetical protein [Spirochaetales bacterium]
MFRQKGIIILFIISSIVLSHSGCNMVISMLDSNSPPVAISCEDYEVYVNDIALLDGKGSYDPDEDTLSFTWKLLSKPLDSGLQNKDIINRNTKAGSVLLDKQGLYKFRLTVSDGIENSSTVLSIAVIPEPGAGGTPTIEPDKTPTPGASATPTESPRPDPTPPFGMVLEYLCNGNADDSSGYGNHGTVYGAQLFPDRENTANKAYFFNDSDYIDCGNGYSLNTYNELSIALWIRPNNLNNGVILSKRETTDIGYELRIDSGSIAFSDGALILIAYIVGDEKLDKWFHVAITWQSFDSPCIYINGEKVGGNTGLKQEDFSPGSGPLLIGKSDIRSDDYYHGAIDDLRIYDRVLTGAEIIDIMNTTQ